MSTLITTPTEDVLFIDALSPTEQEVQELLDHVAQATPEARKIFVARLLQGVAERVTSDLSASAVKSAKGQATQQKAKANAKPSVPDPYKNPAIWPGIGLLELSDQYDPIEGWQHFGRDAYYRIIYYETPTTLEHILAHHAMPKGTAPRKNSTGVTMAKNVIQRLEKHFGYQP